LVNAWKIGSEYRTTWTLLPPNRPAVVLLDHLPGWRRLYADDVAVVHVREDRRRADRSGPGSLPRHSAAVSRSQATSEASLAWARLSAASGRIARSSISPVLIDRSDIPRSTNTA